MDAREKIEIDSCVTKLFFELLQPLACLVTHKYLLEGALFWLLSLELDSKEGSRRR